MKRRLDTLRRFRSDHTVLIGVATVVVIAAAMRLWRLGALPPGLAGAEAGFLESGLRAATGQGSGFEAAAGFAPLSALAVGLVAQLGGSEATWRLVPVVFGTAAVAATWLWVRSWFGLRTAWLAALMMAASPWAITLSRSLSAAAIGMLLMPLLLWLTTLVRRRSGTVAATSLALALVAALVSGPAGWLAASVALIAAAVGIRRPSEWSVRSAAIVVAGLIVGVGSAIWLSRGRIAGLNEYLNLAASFEELSRGFIRTIGMFHVRGSENVLHNLPGEPLLNVFAGLMFVAGFIVAAGRLHQYHYLRLIVAWLVALVPVIVTTTDSPNAGRAALVLPLTYAIVGIGIGRLLELWHATFPTNSAARAAGRAAIGALVILSFVHGYTQYFHAWGGAPETYAASNEPVSEAVRALAGASAGDMKFLVITPAERQVAAVLSRGQGIEVITAEQVAAQADRSGKLRFIITTDARAVAQSALRQALPGGRLVPTVSRYNGRDLFFTYEVTK